ncbi:MAG TPA: hypothetical protein VJI13_06530 [Candidatus Norongarragalinales archaeon]|nr:hypothetical protein [Candidatus Norongarragalinales archaeon]
MDLEQKISDLIGHSGKAPKFPARLARKAALYDFNGTLVSDMKGSGMDNYETKLRQAFGPLREMEDGEIIKAFGKNGITIRGLGKKGVGIEGNKRKDKNLAKPLAESIISIIKSPKRGTKAREIYYDFLELAVERGEISMEPFPDAFAKGNCIEKDRKAGLSIISLSRGTDRLLQKSIDASGTRGIISKMYSTIPYGGEKTAECYYRFFIELMNKGTLIVKCYEDELANVEGMMVADMALAIKMGLGAPPFKIIWIDRVKNCRKADQIEKIRKLGEFYSGNARRYGWGMEFNNIFEIRGGLNG